MQAIDFSHNIKKVSVTFLWRNPTYFGVASNINFWVYAKVFPPNAWAWLFALLGLGCLAMTLIKASEHKDNIVGHFTER